MQPTIPHREPAASFRHEGEAARVMGGRDHRSRIDGGGPTGLNEDAVLAILGAVQGQTSTAQGEARAIRHGQVAVEEDAPVLDEVAGRRRRRCAGAGGACAQERSAQKSGCYQEGPDPLTHATPPHGCGRMCSHMWKG